MAIRRDRYRLSGYDKYVGPVETYETAISHSYRTGIPLYVEDKWGMKHPVHPGSLSC